MDEFGGPRLEGTGNTFKRKRTQTSRRPKPEVPALPENHDQSSLSSTPPSDEAGKISSDENAVDANPKRKVYNLNQCVTRSESDYSSKRYNNESHSNGGSIDANENKLKKVKLKLGGVTRTIQPKFNSATSKNSGSLDVTRARPKLILQDNSDEDDSPSLDKKIGLQGIPWKDFSRVGFTLGRENASTGTEKTDSTRKSKRVPKKRVLDGDFVDEDDDEIRYLEKLRSVRSRDYDDDSSKKHRSLSRVIKDDPSPLTSGRDSGSVDTDYEEEDLVSDNENEGNKGKKPRSDSPDSQNVAKRETTLTSRQRAIRSGRDSASAATQIEFPNGLPPAAPRKQKEKLTDVEQQLKKAEAAERRRIQNEKAARESEAEAIRKILGQDSSRKKREDKLKKRQEELAQEKAANAKILAPNTIRTVIGPTGTTVAFAEDIGLPHIFNPKSSCYPPRRERCVGPSCTNAYKYRDSKLKLPLCSLQCYKAVHEKMQAETIC
ncbi:putative INO80 complex subunit B-like region, Zinc finger, HIT-type, INO80 complex, subunit Ies2 [Helianthus annuus]|uniref:INO80 complex subunit B-like region, Zinc finger, HIT-type, INO80 complex, subunit Ies2 n=1 Tax=Helianthus annuus TaxID=4232 RepID=A0A251UFK3_HELAN|nr:uncharacterized protein LOC110864608 [Helianthus annuus]XP_035830271.1 uncharacterized protein LOC110864608 [Helianthus annuus]KAF5801047.1 putative INO80 complex subunit B-like region, Zinc finger, HIT-type, INO80 complex, subunit Ies2 [Helianthus annuus]KAJ0565357.1 putative INO80 complex subunit B-like region, Zinc finger, HIT-type, INO80 complex, subunit Ies2 [Helianthus annuus]KAJ0572354.1 putative INO80 complex subunit B-like region, Zinc finger, HIT-type, INO80 complex, subunit Ies2 [